MGVIYLNITPIEERRLGQVHPFPRHTRLTPARRGYPRVDDQQARQVPVGPAIRNMQERRECIDGQYHQWEHAGGAAGGKADGPLEPAPLVTDLQRRARLAVVAAGFFGPIYARLGLWVGYFTENLRPAFTASGVVVVKLPLARSHMTPTVDAIAEIRIAEAAHSGADSSTKVGR